MCDQGYDITFCAKYCAISKTNLEILVGKVIMAPGNVYILDEIQGEKCYIRQNDEGWLRHKRL